MSFHVKSAGAIAKVRADVEKSSYMPTGLKADVLAILDGAKTNAARVYAFGHGDSSGYELGKCEVELFDVEVPAAAPVEAPVAAAPPAEDTNPPGSL